ncbi:hypothetical protein F5X68DRAFT_228755 [Plectosphaerella plurivora]|uniref:Uncharacterized protein n=1 Tax=Plectosphaerella plurivora TaxID=936078 RepID=A0A9P9AB66_9PEZI|nr:hypothetical protein F5X68DRAFT_228755 [Plectosphaerella plurivora]
MTQPACPDEFVEQDRRALHSKGRILEVRDDFCIIPFGLKEYPAYFQNDTSRWNSKKIGDRSRTQLVFDHPPRAGHPPAEQARQATLRVERRLKSHEYDETQLLLCSVLKPPKIAGPFIHIPHKGTIVVAKVFDPLFYTPVNDFTDERVDTVAQADREIAHEGTAYKRLSEYSDKAAHPESTLIPGFQPKFYGFWHFLAKSKDPAFVERTRPVRLLLLEYVDGISIAEMSRRKNGTLVPLDSCKQPISDPKKVALKDVDTNANVEANNLFHWQRRLFIIDAVVDGLARQKHMGVDLAHACPIRPDQIIVEGGFDAVTTTLPYSPDLGGNMANPRIVVVNYTRAITGEATAYKSLIWQKVPLPCSPIDYDSLRSLVRLRGWWPASLDKLPDQERAAFLASLVRTNL